MIEGLYWLTLLLNHVDDAGVMADGQKWTHALSHFRDLQGVSPAPVNPLGGLFVYYLKEGLFFQ